MASAQTLPKNDDQARFEELIVERWEMREAIDDFWNYLPLLQAHLEVSKQRSPEALREAYDRAVAHLKKTRVPVERFIAERAKVLATISKSKKVPRWVVDMLSLHEKELIEDMRAVPASLEKTRAALLHKLDSRQDWNDLGVLAFAKEQYGHFDGQAVEKGISAIQREDLSTPPNGLETEWTVFVAWFLWVFGRGMQKDLPALYENFGMDLRMRADEVRMPPPERCEFNSLAEDLWFANRVRPLRARLGSVGRSLLEPLVRSQQADGSWKVATAEGEHPNRREVWIPSSKATSLAVLTLSAYGDERIAKAVHAGSSWILANQLPSGAWESPESFAKPSVIVTLLCLEALASTHDEVFKPAIERGRNWLFAQQRPDGVWEEKGYLEEALTIAIASFLHGATRRTSLSGGFESIGFALFARAEELATHDSDIDRSLSLVAIYHGIEMLLYSYLERHGEPIHRSSSKETIGFRDAMAAFEARLVSEGKLVQGKSAKGAGNLRLMASSRDAFIHRGQLVTESDLHRFLDASHKFLDEYRSVLSET